MQEILSIWPSGLAQHPENLKKVMKTFYSSPHFSEQFLRDKNALLIFIL